MNKAKVKAGQDKGSVWIEVVASQAGNSLNISDAAGNGYRISGPKPYGGGKVLYRFKVSSEELRQRLTEGGAI